MHIHMHECTHIHTLTHIHISLHLLIHIHISHPDAQTHVHTFLHTQRDTQIYTCMHTIHMHTHTHRDIRYQNHKSKDNCNLKTFKKCKTSERFSVKEMRRVTIPLKQWFFLTL